MLKTIKNELSPSVVSTLVYLQSLLNGDDQVLLSVTKDGIQVVTNDDELLNPITLPKESCLVNPIANILYHINDEMCSDCLKDDWQFKNPFFVDLVESYVDSLVHTYGLEVPITYELARAIVKWGLTEYHVLRQIVDHGMRSVVLAYQDIKPEYTYYLNAKTHATTN